MNAQQLKNAILQEAIEGRLVPQDPNDEPASVLLERIRKEKEQLVKEGKLKKKDLEVKPISEDEIPFDIPESWEWVRLGYLINLLSGRDLSPTEYNKSNNGIPYMTGASNFESGILIVNRWTNHPATISHKGDLLITCKGTIGEMAFNTIGDLHVARQIMAINSHSLNLNYVRFFLMRIVSELENKAKSIIPGISREDILNASFPLPPLAEQHRIVAKIEELLPKVEEYGKAQDELNKLNEELPERLKKSILQEAIEGRLVPQDPSDEPASILLDKIRKEKEQQVKEGKLKKKDLIETPISEDEIPFDIPKSWEWVRLGTISKLLGGFAFKSHEYTNDGSRVVRISDVSEEGFVNKNVVRHPYDNSLAQYVICSNDILMAMTGGTVGKSLLVKTLPEEKMLLNQRVAVIRCNGVLVDYINYVIKSDSIQSVISDSKNSTNDNISMADIYNFMIPLPPLTEQHRIVEKLEQLLGETDKLKV